MDINEMHPVLMQEACDPTFESCELPAEVERPTPVAFMSLIFLYIL